MKIGSFHFQHQAFLLEAKEREPEVLFLGDSIFAQLQQTEVWPVKYCGHGT